MKKKLMRKKHKLILSCGISLFTVLGVTILIAALMVMDFFGANITDGYIENNMEYSENYLNVLNLNISKGYVALERILYFYIADNKLKFNDIYQDNLDKELKQVLPISDVCLKEKYKYLDVCKKENIDESSQINEIQSKPFVPPIDIGSSTITSFFMQERIIYDTYGIHQAIDFGAKANTPVYAVADCKVKKISFPYSENKIDKSGSGGNNITLECEVDEIKYVVKYMHLYPNSAIVKENEIVKKGTKIAEVGTTGYSTGNHLHYQVERDGVTIDGLSLINFVKEDEKTDIPDNYVPNSNVGINVPVINTVN